MSNKETDLYEPINNYLTELGFRVDAEVNGCDIVASLNNDILIVELKNSFSLKLLYQAVERQKLSNTVYVAIPNRGAKKYPPNIKNIKTLLKRLDIGLLIVHFRNNNSFVEPYLDAKLSTVRSNNRKRLLLLKELDGRYHNFNIGGSRSSNKTITAYLLDSIQIAVVLNKYGQSSPSQLQKRGTSPNTQSILSNNYNKWFERVERGIYKLNKDGKAALLKFSVQSDYFRKKL